MNSVFNCLPKQKLFLEECDKKRFILFNGGVQSGKSRSGALQDWRAVIENKPPHLGWVVAGSYAQTETVMGDFEDLLQGGIKRKTTMEGARVIFDIWNGHRVEFRTARNPDALRGPRVGWVHVDEGREVSKECMDVLYGRVLRYKGKIWVTSTPSGKHWWGYKDFYLRTCRNTPWFDEDYGYIHCTSLENWHLDPKEIEKLRAKYTGAFAAQELEAQFVGYEGLVYKDFDPGAHICAPVSHTDPNIKRVLAGIDFGLNDPFVRLIVALIDGRWKVVEEYYWDQGGKTVDHHAPYLLESAWNSKIDVCYSDYHDPEGQATLRRYGIANVSAPHHEIYIGIHEVTRLLGTRLNDGFPALQVCSNCPKTIEEFGLYRYPEERETKNVGDKPLDKYNHCFVAGTEIETDKGPRDIEEILEDDLVLTRDGFHPVRKAWITRRDAPTVVVTLDDGRTLRGTPEHRVWVDETGWITLDTLRYGDKIVTCKERFIAAESSGCIAESDISAVERNGCIASSGVTQTARFLRDIMYTTQTAIPLTIGLKTLSCCNRRPTRVATAQRASGCENYGSIWTEFGIRRLGGIGRKREDAGMAKTPSRLRQRERKGVRSVPGVGGLIGAKPQSGSARTLASLRVAAPMGGIEFPDNARYAGLDIIPADSSPRKLAVAHVVRVSDGKPADVYALHVKTCHEFFANGILAANSLDSLRYALFGENHSVYRGPKKEEKKEPGPGTYGWWRKRRHIQPVGLFPRRGNGFSILG